MDPVDLRPRGPSLLPPTGRTTQALAALVLVVLATTAYLTASYPSLPSLIPVHFRAGFADGWQFKSI